MNQRAFLSPSWYRVAQLKLRVKPQAQIRRQRFRQQTWYVIQDPVSGRYNRFTPATYQIIGLIDGQRTMDEVWAAAVEQLGDDTPSQDEIIGLLTQLHSTDLLKGEVNPDVAELFERFAKEDKSRGRSNFKNPFSIRIPLWDPDRFLERSIHWVRPLGTWVAAAVYVAVVVYAVVQAGVYWPELTGNLSDRLLSEQNLLALWLCFPLVKFLHEMGHAYATKAGGGEVHEMGIMFLVFMPIPYVDASAATGFRSKWHRVLVGAAGMLVEVFIAAVFLLVWVAAEPGLVRALAFNIILIAGVSTLIFNGNPLLRYDAYYIFSDLIEMPNLATRGTAYWRYLIERRLFRISSAEPPLMSDGERRWVYFYTPAALIYRTFVLVAIVLYIATEWFFIGVLLAIFGAVMMLGIPLAKAIAYLGKLPTGAGARNRAITITACGVGGILAFLFLVPMPLRVGVEGIVWLPEEANVRAGSPGFVSNVVVPGGRVVESGDILIESSDPELSAALEVSRWRLAELEAELDAHRFVDRVAADITRKEIEQEKATYDRLLERSYQLVARSSVKGVFVLDRNQDVPGRYYRQGDSFGYVVQQSEPIVRMAVAQDDVDLVRSRLRKIEVRLREATETIYPASLVREVPAAKDTLPKALTSEGGGAIAADPRDPQSGKTLDRMFQFDLALPEEARTAHFGGRVYVRMSMDPEPLAIQWGRRIRQLFLERFSV